jgi:hypothetical protein
VLEDGRKTHDVGVTFQEQVTRHALKVDDIGGDGLAELEDDERPGHARVPAHSAEDAGPMPHPERAGDLRRLTIL